MRIVLEPNRREFEPSESLDKDLAGEGEDRKAYVGRIHGIIDILKRELRRAMAEQMDMIARHGQNWDMVTFGRGGINLAEVLWERFEKLSSEHLGNIQQDKEDSAEK